MTDVGGSSCAHVLGPIVLTHADGTTVDPGSPTQRRLLALLALAAPRPVRRERVGGALDLSPSAVRTTVSRLRRTVGAGLVTTTTGYRLDLPVDAAVLCRQLADAGHDADAIDRVLARWGGPALEEFAAEPWAAGEAARLDEIRATAVEDRAEALVGARRAAEAVAALDAHVAVHPYRDRAWGLLVRSLAATGRQADALRAFQRYRALLAEVGTEPSEDVRCIERRVAAGWNGVAAPPTPVAAGGRSFVVPLPPELGDTGPIVGRDADLAALHDELAAVRAAGRLRVATVFGDEGIGKSTLLAAFARAARQGDRSPVVVHGRCGGLGTVPLQPFRSIVGALVDHGPRDLLAAHTETNGGVLLGLAPRLARRIDVRAALATDDATGRFVLFEAVADLLQRAADLAPIVVIVDDVHWADPSDLQLLGHLGHALAASSVLLVLGARDTEQDPTGAFGPTLAKLARVPGRRIELGGLDAASVELLTRLLLGDDGALDAVTPSDAAIHLCRETAGNPLFVHQLVRHWATEGRLALEPDRAVRLTPGTSIPASLRDIVRHRVERLGPTVKPVLTAAAVLGASVAERLLRHMVDLSDRDVDAALDSAVRAGLLRQVEPGVLRFAHALVASAIAGDATGPELRRLNERAALAMLDVTDALGPARTAALARHFEQAGCDADALRWAAAAGDEALDQLAPLEAAEWYATAMGYAERLGRPEDVIVDLLVRRGEALVRAGRPEGLSILLDGATRAWRAGADRALVHAALATDRGFARMGELAADQLRIVEQALEVGTLEHGERACLLALLGQSLVHTGATERRCAAAREALDLARRSEDPTLLARLAPAALSALWLPGPATERMQLAREAVVSAERSRDPYLSFLVHTAAFNAAVTSADARAAQRWDARRRELAGVLGDRGRWMAGVTDTFLHTMAARFEDAGRVADETVHLGMEIGEPDAFTIYAGQLYALRTFEGRHAELVPLVEQVMAAGPVLLPFRIGYGILCAATGREDEACALLESGLSTGFEAIGADQLWLTSIIGYAVLATELDHREAARALYPLIEPYAAEVAFNGSTSQGPVAAYLGKLASLLDDHEAADAHLRAALAITEDFGWTYHRATTLHALAAARHRRHGCLDDASRAMLAEAGTVCRSAGIRIWAARVEALDRLTAAP